jgi:quinol monooxygenase YgiN
MIMLSGRIVAKTTERRELVQALLDWAATTRRDPELATAYVYEDVEIPAVFGLVTEWKTAVALDAHLRSDSFGVLLGALKVLARPHNFVITRGDDEAHSEIGAANRLQAEGKAAT